MTVVEAPPDRIRFEIEDRGPGIPEDMLAGWAPDELAIGRVRASRRRA